MNNKLSYLIFVIMLLMLSVNVLGATESFYCDNEQGGTPFFGGLYNAEVDLYVSTIAYEPVYSASGNANINIYSYNGSANLLVSKVNYNHGGTREVVTFNYTEYPTYIKKGTQFIAYYSGGGGNNAWACYNMGLVNLNYFNFTFVGTDDYNYSFGGNAGAGGQIEITTIDATSCAYFNRTWNGTDCNEITTLIESTLNNPSNNTIESQYFPYDMNLNITSYTDGSDNLTVSFYEYNGSDYILLYNQSNVENNTEVTYDWEITQNGTYYWYYNITDGTTTTESDLLQFTLNNFVLDYYLQKPDNQSSFMKLLPTTIPISVVINNTGTRNMTLYFYSYNGTYNLLSSGVDISSPSNVSYDWNLASEGNYSWYFNFTDGSINQQGELFTFELNATPTPINVSYSNIIGGSYWYNNLSYNISFTGVEDYNVTWYKNNIELVRNVNLTQYNYTIGDEIKFNLYLVNGTYVYDSNTTVTTILGGTFVNFNLTEGRNATASLNLTAYYDYANVNIISRNWLVDDINVLSDSDILLRSYYNDSSNITFSLILENGTGIYYEHNLSVVVYDDLAIGNPTYTINVLSYVTSDLNVSVDAYLDNEFEVEIVSGQDKDNFIFRWFKNGVSYVSGLGLNVINFFWTIDEVGDNTISVNVSSVDNSTTSETITWNVNVTLPTLEPDQLSSDVDVWDSIDIFCSHNYTGHNWYFDIDVRVNDTNESIVWKNVVSLGKSEIYKFDISTYNNYNNVSVRCRTWNEYFNYSNYTYIDGIVKGKRNQVKVFKKFPKPNIVDDINSYETLCDMSNNENYYILYHWVDVNGDGIFDKFKEYDVSDNVRSSKFSFDTKYLVAGEKDINSGCIISKRDTSKWEFSNCLYDETECAVQKSYTFEVFDR